MIAANFSMDFELAWGDLQRVARDDAFHQRVLGGRALTERVVGLLEKYSIQSVWGIVGACCVADLDALRKSAPAAYQLVAADLEELQRRRPDYAQLLFCPDLIRRISASPMVEIASHGFLHLYPRGVDSAVLREDVVASVEALRAATGRNVMSFIPPQNFEWPEAAFEGSGIRFIRHTPSVFGYAYSDARAPAKFARLWNDFVLPKSQRGTDGRDAKLLFLRIDRGAALWKSQKLLMRRLLASGRRTLFFFSHPHNLDTPAMLERFEEFCEIIAAARERSGVAFAPFAKEVGGGRLATYRT